MKNKALVVDDSSLARRLTRKILEELDFEVEEASDGAQALEKFVVIPPNLVMLDMVMHGMYGLDVLIKLRQMDAKIPIVVATADIQTSTRQQVKDAGASAMVNKPLQKEELADVLRSVMKGEYSWS